MCDCNITPNDVADLIDPDEIVNRLIETLDLSEIAEMIASHIDASDVASHMDLNDVAGEIDLNDLAERIDLSELAGEIDHDDIAKDLCYSSLSEYICTESIASYVDVDASDVASALEDAFLENFDYENLADAISGDDDACREIAKHIEAKNIASHVQDPWSMMVTPFN